MSLSTSATINIALTYNQTDVQNGVRINDLAQSGYSTSLSNSNSGTGNLINSGVISAVYSNRLSIPGTGTLALDLTNLTRTFLNSTISLSLSSGRLLNLFVNNLTDNQIHIKTTGSNVFNAWNGGGTGGLIIAPKNPWQLNANLTGYPVTSSQRLIHFVNPGPSGDLDFIILGLK